MCSKPGAGGLRRSTPFLCFAARSPINLDLHSNNPHANKLTVHILAAVAQHECEIISARIAAALKAAAGIAAALNKRGITTARGKEMRERTAHCSERARHDGSRLALT